ncbi:hypothetical protein F4780DRAFT_783080 [Xylariomycetidae sp. FL0641]|nr:hypothetical protein F4780DRAFT_783080 [Xylariomycetidae sp. FL0641]
MCQSNPVYHICGHLPTYAATTLQPCERVLASRRGASGLEGGPWPVCAINPSRSIPSHHRLCVQVLPSSCAPCQALRAAVDECWIRVTVDLERRGVATAGLEAARRALLFRDDHHHHHPDSSSTRWAALQRELLLARAPVRLARRHTRDLDRCAAACAGIVARAYAEGGAWRYLDPGEQRRRRRAAAEARKRGRERSPVRFAEPPPPPAEKGFYEFDGYSSPGSPPAPASYPPQGYQNMAKPKPMPPTPDTEGDLSSLSPSSLGSPGREAWVSDMSSDSDRSTLTSDTEYDEDSGPVYQEGSGPAYGEGSDAEYYGGAEQPAANLAYQGQGQVYATYGQHTGYGGYETAPTYEPAPNYETSYGGTKKKKRRGLFGMFRR